MPAPAMTPPPTAPLSDLTIVVRHSGERTREACVDLLRPLVPPEALRVVGGVPFSRTLRASLQAGLDAGRTWTLCIDADVLVFPGAVARLLSAARAQPSACVELQGVVHDKFFGVFRPAGNHCYRTRDLARALECIPPEGGSLRPETDMLEALRGARGAYYRNLALPVGAHDFEQSFHDVFCKCLLQAFKHVTYLETLRRAWSERAASDPDFRVALAALRVAREHAGPPVVTREFGQAQAFATLAALGLQEKPPLGACDPVALSTGALVGLSARGRLRRRVLQDAIAYEMRAVGGYGARYGLRGRVGARVHRLRRGVLRVL